MRVSETAKLRPALVTFEGEYHTQRGYMVYNDAVSLCEFAAFTEEQADEFAAAYRRLVNTHDNGTPETFPLFQKAVINGQTVYIESYHDGVNDIYKPFTVDGVELWALGFNWCTSSYEVAPETYAGRATERMPETCDECPRFSSSTACAGMYGICSHFIELAAAGDVDPADVLVKATDGPRTFECVAFEEWNEC